MKFSFNFGRTTPFVVFSWWGIAAAATAPEPTGRWLFVDDGSGIEIAACPAATDGLCGTLVQLPRSAAPITGAERKQLCGLTMLGSLKVGDPKRNELLRLDGWVLDPETLRRTDQPKRYAASLIITSEVSARLDVRGPLNIVLESHRLMRPVAPVAACE
jgi:hypothetical protein